MFLAREVSVCLVVPGPPVVLLDVLRMLVYLLLVHLRERIQRLLDVGDQGIGLRSGEVLTDNDTHHLEACVRWGSVRGHDPAPLTELVSNGELVKVIFLLRVQAERDERESSTMEIRHEEETESLYAVRKVVGGPGEVKHDVAVATLSETNELVVLCYHLRGPPREVECEGRLIGAQIGNMKDQFLWEVFWVTPNAPSNARVDEAILMTAHIDGDDLWQPEIPHQVWVDEGSDKATGGSINWRT